MANDYFQHDTPLTRHTLARSEQVNQTFQAIEAGFDKLPDPVALTQGRHVYVQDTGAANAYIATLASPPAGYTDGLSFMMRAANSNTGPSTINVNGLGVKQLRTLTGDPTPPGYIEAGAVMLLAYDGAAFRVVGGNALDPSASAALAQAALYTIRGTYYGALAADPTLDPNGNPPTSGDWYFNTVVENVRLYHNGAWSDFAAAKLDTFIFTAMGSETSLSGVDDDGRILAYTAGFLQLFLNGVLLTPGADYTATDGSTITGLAALTGGDVVVVQAFRAFSLLDVYLKSEADALFARSADLGTMATQDANNVAITGGTFPATVVLTTATQTLTNKTLTSPTVTGGTINNTPIGGTTANTGSFTTLTASTSVTTPSVTRAGTLALSATGANIITASTNGSERVRITSAGNVGIGTTSPGGKLDISTPNTGAATSVELATGASSRMIVRGDYRNVFEGGYGFTGIICKSGGWEENASGIFFGTRTGNSSQRDDGVLAFATRPQGDESVERLTERMRIDSAGSVGIGTTAPRAICQINSGVDASALRISDGNHNGSGSVFRYPVASYWARQDAIERTGSNPLASGSPGGSSAAIVFTDEPGNFTNTQVVRSSGIEFWTANNWNGSSLGQYPELRLGISSLGIVYPGADDTQTLGSASNRWSEVFAGNGTINTSDAREKTAVRALTAAEIAAAKDLAKEIGAFQFLAAVEKKGDDARTHIGMTVQKAIEIMEAHDLDPMAYGFICHDEWDAKTTEHPATDDAEAWTETTLEAGDRYGFRADQLLLFIARGFEARLAALEAAAG